jgi:hypothetical protein
MSTEDWAELMIRKVIQGFYTFTPHSENKAGQIK